MTGKEAYASYLQSDHWKNLRAMALKKSRYRCVLSTCGSTKSLHVHHMNYRNWYNCTTDDLLVLCESCHSSLHVNLDHFGLKPSDCRTVGTIRMIESIDWASVPTPKEMEALTEDDPWDPTPSIMAITADEIQGNLQRPDPESYPTVDDVHGFYETYYPDLVDEKFNPEWELSLMKFDRLHLNSKEWNREIPMEWKCYLEKKCSKTRKCRAERAARKLALTPTTTDQ